MRQLLEAHLFPAFDPAIAEEEGPKMHVISARSMGANAAVVHLVSDRSRGVAWDDGGGLRRVYFHLALEMPQDARKIVHIAIMDA